MPRGRYSHATKANRKTVLPIVDQLGSKNEERKMKDKLGINEGKTKEKEDLPFHLPLNNSTIANLVLP